MNPNRNTLVKRYAVWLVVLLLAAFAFAGIGTTILSAAEQPNVVILLANDKYVSQHRFGYKRRRNWQNLANFKEFQITDDCANSVQFSTINYTLLHPVPIQFAGLHLK